MCRGALMPNHMHGAAPMVNFNRGYLPNSLLHEPQTFTIRLSALNSINHEAMQQLLTSLMKNKNMPGAGSKAVDHRARGNLIFVKPNSTGFHTTTVSC